MLRARKAQATAQSVNRQQIRNRQQRNPAQAENQQTQVKVQARNQLVPAEHQPVLLVAVKRLQRIVVLKLKIETIARLTLYIQFSCFSW